MYVLYAKKHSAGAPQFATFRGVHSSTLHPSVVRVWMFACLIQHGKQISRVSPVDCEIMKLNVRNVFLFFYLNLQFCLPFQFSKLQRVNNSHKTRIMTFGHFKLTGMCGPFGSLGHFGPHRPLGEEI